MTNRRAAIRIIKILRKAGYQALFAGGCVRDMLLKRPAKDYDVATDAHPDNIIRLFRRTLKVGAKFGVVMVMIESEQVEVATFRTEAGYADGRHPGAVSFADPKQDALRRDFTINGMFYDPIGRQVIDYVGGQKDLEKSLLRTIGNASVRFSEDYLRMLRAVRFSTQLNFKIAPATWQAVCELAPNITKISAERISAELEGILTNPARGRGAKMLIESSLAGCIFEGFDGEQPDFGASVLGFLRKQTDFPLTLAAMFAGCETNRAMEKCTRLKLSRAHTKHTQYLLAGRGRLLKKDMGLAEFKLLLASPYYADLYELQRAIQKAGRQTLGALIALTKRARDFQDVDLKPKPLLNGHELIALGARPGPMVGQLSQELYIAQLSDEIKTSEQAKLWAAHWLTIHQVQG